MTQLLTSFPLQSSASTRLAWGTIVFMAVFHGIALLAPWFFSWSALGLAIGFHWLLGSIGICLGYHRLLSHRSLQVPKWLEYVLVTLGALALQGSPIFWVAGHRLHHAHTEHLEDDPYSSKRGFWWSHMGWLFSTRPQFFHYSIYRKSAPDLDRDAYYRWLDRYYLIPQVLLAIALYLVGGWSFVIYGIFVRSLILWHSTWLVNSACHMWGYRNFEADDNARNLWWAALLTYGEGWHNNHHAHPRVAKAGYRWWEIDMTWWAIRLLMVLGLATKVVELTPANQRPPYQDLAI